MSELLKASARETVIAVVEDLTQDWGLDLSDPVGGTTMLAADLQFASVDIIQLCVALEQTYGRRFGFQDLLMKDGSYVGDLSIAQFADFIIGRLAGQGVTP
jgi:acyl carrier protein